VRKVLNSTRKRAPKKWFWENRKITCICLSASCCSNCPGTPTKKQANNETGMRSWQILRGHRLSCGSSLASRLESAAAVSRATLTGARWGAQPKKMAAVSQKQYK